MPGFSPKLPQVIRQIDDQEVQRTFDQYRTALPALFSNPLLSGNFVSTKLTLGITNLVQHKLKRKFQGWFVTDLTTQTQVWRDGTSTANLAIYLPLVTSATVTVTLWIF